MPDHITPQLDLPMDAIRAYCEKWHIVEFALFGSILRADFNDESDIDVLFRFADDVRYTLFDLVYMNDELEAILGRKVDLIDRLAIEESPNYIRRKEILSTSEVVYAT
jgi:predicted nucleotidyltransferase